MLRCTAESAEAIKLPIDAERSLTVHSWQLIAGMPEPQLEGRADGWDCVPVLGKRKEGMVQG